MKKLRKPIIAIVLFLTGIVLYQQFSTERKQYFNPDARPDSIFEPVQPEKQPGKYATYPSLRSDGVSVDESGNLYVIDKFNSQIKKVTQNRKTIVVAGNGIAGFSGDGGEAVEASLNIPENVAVDAYGTLYIADTRNHRVRKVENGIISTIAGNGAPGYSGDGELATNASLNFPSDVLVTSEQIIYIADNHNHRIRKIDENGIITTIAGNGISGNTENAKNAVDTNLNFPEKLSTSSDNNLLLKEKHDGKDSDQLCEITAEGLIKTLSSTNETNIVAKYQSRKRSITYETSSEPPDVPTDLKFSKINALYSITLSWESVETANSYIIEWKKNDEAWDRLDRTELSSYTDDGGNSGFIPNSTYSYHVQACVDGSTCSSFSEAISHTFINDTPMILDIQDYTINEDLSIPVRFMVCDAETVAYSLIETATAHNKLLFPSSNMFIESCATCANRTLWLTPAADMAGSSYIDITVSDLHDGSTVHQFTITVNPVGDKPVISNIADQTIAEDPDTPLSVSFSLTDVDQYFSDNSGSKNYSDTITISSESQSNTLIALLDPSSTIITKAPDDTSQLTITINPANNAFGETQITITATDSHSLTNTRQFLFTVTPVNDAPEIHNINSNYSTLEDTPKTISGITLTDVDSSNLNITITVSEPKLVTISHIHITPATFNYETSSYSIEKNSETVSVEMRITPLENAFGSSDITISVSDGYLTDEHTFSLTVNSVNDAPVLSQIENLSTDEDTSTTTFFQLTDVEGGNFELHSQSEHSERITVDNITFSGSNVENYSVVVTALTSKSINIHLTPVHNANENSLITITVIDNGVEVLSSFSLYITPVNDIPEISSIPDKTIDEDQPLGVNITLTDIDKEEYLTISAISSLTSVLLNSDICLNNDCTNNWELYMDRSPEKTMTLNIKPLSNIPWQTSYTETEITIRVNDTSGGYTETSFKLTVNAVDDPPIFSTIQPIVMDEDTISYPVSFTVADCDGGNVTITISSADTALASNENILLSPAIYNLQAIAIPQTITFYITPTANLHGETTISLTVTDQTGLFQSRSCSLTVNPVEDAPVMGNIENLTMDEDTISTALSFTVVDVDHESLSITYTSDNTTLFSNNEDHILFINNGTPVQEIDANSEPQSISIQLKPAPDQWGESKITVSIIDNNDCSELCSHQQSFTVTVHAVNDAPELSIGQNTIFLESGVASTLSFSVIDVDNDWLDISYTCTHLNLISIGLSHKTLLASDTASFGTISLTPSTNISHIIPLTLTAKDNDGLYSNAVFNIVIHDRPNIGMIDDISIDEDAFSCGNAFTITDADSETLTISYSVSDEILVPTESISFSENLIGTERTFQMNTDSQDITFCYTPPSQLSGISDITITVTDSYHYTAIQSFSFTVISQADTPTIATISNISMDEDTVKQLSVTIGDADGQPLSMFIHSDDQSLVMDNHLIFSTNENIMLDGSNTQIINLSITPEANMFGETAITLTVTDGQYFYYTSFTLKVDGIPDSPTITYSPDLTSPWELIEEEPVPGLTISVADVDGGEITLTCKHINSIIPTSAMSFSNGKCLMAFSIGIDETVPVPLSITLPVNEFGDTGISLSAIGENDTYSVTEIIDIQIKDDNDPPVLSPAYDKLVYTIAENSVLSIPFSVSDVDGNKLFLSYVSDRIQQYSFQPTDEPTPPKNESIDITCIVSPETDQIDEAIITITVKDRLNNENTEQDSLSYTVIINDAPQLDCPSTYTISENAPQGYTLGRIQFTDEESDNYTLTIVNDNVPFSLIGNDLVLDGTIKHETRSDYYLTINAQDFINSSNASIHILITEAPEFSNKEYQFTITENASINDNVGSITASNDTPYAYTIVSGNDNNQFAISGSVSATIFVNQKLDYETQKSYTLTILADDGDYTDTAKVIISVSDYNEHTPLFADSYAFSITENSNNQIIGTVIAHDEDPTDILFYSLINGGPFSINSSSGEISLNGSVNYEDKSSYAVTAVASDSKYSDTAQVNISIIDSNESPPVFTASSYSFQITENAQLSTSIGQVTATDNDGSAVISYTITSGHPVDISENSGIIYVNGAINYEDINAYTLTVRAYDGNYSDTAAVNIEIIDTNDPPVANSSAFTINEDYHYGRPSWITATDEDETNSSLNCYLIALPEKGNVTPIEGGFDYNFEDEVHKFHYSYYPFKNENGIDTFTFVASDGSLTSTIAKITITIIAVNDPPTANNMHIHLPEDTPKTFTLDGSDPDGDSLSYTITSFPLVGSIESFNEDNGQLIYIPALNVNGDGADYFIYKVKDPSEEASSEAIVTIHIKQVNDNPVAKDIIMELSVDKPIQTLKRMGCPQFTVDGMLDGDDVDHDDDKDKERLSYSILEFPVTGLLTHNQKEFKYVNCIPSQSTTYTFTYIAIDDSEMKAQSEPATVTIKVIVNNQSPVAYSDTQYITQTTITYELKADDPERDSLIYEIVTPPENGAYHLLSSGLMTYTPVASGTESFTFKVNDGETDSNIATVVFRITQTEHHPIAYSDTLFTNEDEPLTYTLQSNTSSIGYSIITWPNYGHMTLTESTGFIHYTPYTNYFGEDQFIFIANSSAGASTPAKVSISITSVNDIPVAYTGTRTINENSDIVLAQLTAYDADGDALTYSISHYPIRGELDLINPNNGSFTYQVNENEDGIDTFQFFVSDDYSNSEIMTYTITINEKHFAPLALSDSFSVSEGAIEPRSLSAIFDEDILPDHCSYTIVSMPQHGRLTLDNAKTGAYHYHSDPDYVGDDSFLFKASDNLYSDTAIVKIEIGSIQDAPIVENGNLSVTEDSPSINSSIIAYDPDIGDSLSYTYNTLPDKGDLQIYQNGNYSYKPRLNENGTDFFTVDVSDSISSANARIDIMILPENDPPEISSIEQQSVNEDSGSVSIPFKITDVDGDHLQISVSTGDLIESTKISGLTVTALNDQSYSVILTDTSVSLNISITPSENAWGETAITLTVYDGQVDTQTKFALSIESINDPPGMSQINDISIDEDTSGSISISLTDVDANSLTVTVDIQTVDWLTNENIRISGAQQCSDNYCVNLADQSALIILNMQPQPDQSGSVSLTMTVSDGQNQIKQTFTLTVIPQADPPTITSINSFSVYENETADPRTFTVCDADIEPLTLTIECNDPKSITLVKRIISDTDFTSTGDNQYRIVLNESSAALTFSLTPITHPLIEEPVTLLLTFTVSDLSSSVSESFTIRVNPKNYPPEMSDISNITFDEDTSVSVPFMITDLNAGIVLIKIGGYDNQLIQDVHLTSENQIIPDNNNYNLTMENDISAEVFLHITPLTNMNGTAPLSITVTDGNTSCSSQLTVTINSIPDSPQIRIIENQTTLEDTAMNPVEFTITDVDSSQLTITIDSGDDTILSDMDTSITICKNSVCANNTMTISNDNQTLSLTLMPKTNQSGDLSVTITVIDDQNVRSSRTFSLKVEAVNDPPQLTNGNSFSITENCVSSTFAFSITAFDVDNIDALTYSITNAMPSNPFSININTGKISVKDSLNFEQCASYALTISVSDQISVTTQQVTANIININDPPFISTISDQRTNEDVAIQSISFTVSDADADDLTISIKSSDPSIVSDTQQSITMCNGSECGNNTILVTSDEAVNLTLTLLPEKNANGALMLSLTVTDSELAHTSSFSLSVLSVNDPPCFISGNSFSISENCAKETFAYSITAVDIENETLSYSIINCKPSNPFALSQSTIYVNNWIDYETQISYELTIMVSDSENQVTKNIMGYVQNINDPPVISDISDQQTNEHTETHPITFSITATDSNQLTISIQSSNQSILPENTTHITITDASGIIDGPIALTTENNYNLTLIILPAKNQYGALTVTMTVVNEHGLNASQSFALSVIAINDPPAITSTTMRVFENVENNYIVGTITASDIDSENLRYKISNGNINDVFKLDKQSIIVNDSSKIQPDQIPMYTLTISVSDDMYTQTADIYVQVFKNQFPVISEMNDIYIEEDSQKTVLLTVHDTDGDAITVTVISSDETVVPNNTENFFFSESNANMITLSNTSTAVALSLTVIPLPNVFGSITLTICVTDIYLAETCSAFSLNITSINNDLPLISQMPDDTINEDTSNYATGFTVTDADGGVLSICVSSFNNALSENHLSIMNTGTIVSFNTSPAQISNFTLNVNPPKNLNGVFPISISIKDITGLTASRSFTLTINAIPDAPILSDISPLSMLEDAAASSITFFIVDVDSEDILNINIELSDNSLLYTETTNLNNLQASPIPETLTLTLKPAPEANGAALLTITVTDSYGLTALESFKIDILPVNDAPGFTIGADQKIIGNMGEPQCITNWASNILRGPENESDQALKFFTRAIHPDLFVDDITVDSNGTLCYTPFHTADGRSTISVWLSDEQSENCCSITQTFEIEIRQINHPPSFQCQHIVSVSEDAGMTTIDSWATDLSPGAFNEHMQNLSFHIQSNSNPSLFTAPPEFTISGTTAALNFTPSQNANGKTIISVLIHDDGGILYDGHDQSASQELTITVQSVNDLPSFQKGRNLIAKQASGTKNIANWATHITPGPKDESKQSLQFQIDCDNTNIFEALPAIDPLNGNLSFKPSEDVTGISNLIITLIDSEGGKYSDTCMIQVDQTEPPTISPIEDQKIAQDQSLGPIMFTIGDTETAVEALSVSAISSDLSIVTLENIVLSGLNAERAIQITPVNAQFGKLTITVYVSDNVHQSSTQFQLTVHAKPSANIGLANGYTCTGAAPMAIAFSPTNLQNEIDSFLWTFGDTETNDEMFPIHRFLMANGESESSYTVSLTVSGPGGSSYTEKTDFIKVYPSLYIDFTGMPIEGSVPLTVTFDNFSDGPAGSTYVWDFGDGYTSTVYNPTHTYTQSGIYPVKLHVTDSMGNSKDKTRYFSVYGRKITGTVKDGNETCLSNFHVELRDSATTYNEQITVSTTDENGHFTLNNLPAKDNLVVCVFPPYDNQMYIRQCYSNQTRIGDANKLSTQTDDLTDINFNLNQISPYGISGMVQNENGDGLPFVSVDALSIDDSNVSSSTTTDENGFYTLLGLNLGQIYWIYSYSDQYQLDYYYLNQNQSVTSREQAVPITPTVSIQNEINIIHAIGRTISGTVFSEMQAVSGQWVSGIALGTTPQSTKTDQNGQYTLVALEYLPYTVQIETSNYAYQAYSLATSPGSATPVTPTCSHIDFYLETGNAIKGRVVDTAGNPLSNIWIYVWPAGNMDAIQQIKTLADGKYEISNAMISENLMICADGTDQGYPLRYYSDALSPEHAQTINNTYGDVSDIDFELEKIPVIHGFVTDEQGDPLTGILVSVRSIDDNHDYITNDEGWFECTGLKSEQQYLLFTSSSDYMPAYYSESKTVYVLEDATRIYPSQNYRNITLKKGYNISGIIVSKDQSLLESIEIHAEMNGMTKAFDTIALIQNNEISYSLNRLPPGEYSIYVSSSQFIDQSQNIVIKNSNITDINFSLERPTHKINGKIFNLSPEHSVQLRAYSEDTGVLKKITVQRTEDSSYTIDQLKPGKYCVCLSSKVYETICYENSSTCDGAKLLDLSVTDANEINFYLPDHVEMSGTVFFPSDAIHGESVSIEASSINNEKRFDTVVSYNGNKAVSYRISGLSKDIYCVGAISSCYLKQYYQLAMSENDSLSVNTTDLLPDNEIDFILTRGESISGKIIDINDIGISGAWVSIDDSEKLIQSDSLGVYQISGLQMNHFYKVKASKFIDTPQHYYHESENYIFNENKAANVLSGSTGIDIMLMDGLTISGSIIADDSGLPLPHILVQACSEWYGIEHGTISDLKGDFTIKGLPEGSYIVGVYPNNSEYIGMKTEIRAGSKDVLFRLEKGFTLSGIITSEATGHPISTVEVSIHGYHFDTTDLNGIFEINGLTFDNVFDLSVSPAKTSPFAITHVTGISVDHPFVSISLPKGFTIDGYVKDAETNNPVPNILMRISSLNSTANTDEIGYFKFTNLAYGSYLINTIIDNGYINQMLSADSATQVNFFLKKAGKISGYVSDAKGPLSGIKVSIYSETLGGYIDSKRTNMDGFYLFNGLQENYDDCETNCQISDYKIRAHGSETGYSDITRYNKRVNNTVNFLFESAPTITGIICDPDGKPLPSDSPYDVKINIMSQPTQNISVPKNGTGFFESAPFDKKNCDVYIIVLENNTYKTYVHKVVTPPEHINYTIEN